jgi:hypothetical protein
MMVPLILGRWRHIVPVLIAEKRHGIPRSVEKCVLELELSERKQPLFVEMMMPGPRLVIGPEVARSEEAEKADYPHETGNSHENSRQTNGAPICSIRKRSVLGHAGNFIWWGKHSDASEDLPHRGEALEWEYVNVNAIMDNRRIEGNSRTVTVSQLGEFEAGVEVDVVRQQLGSLLEEFIEMLTRHSDINIVVPGDETPMPDGPEEGPTVYPVAEPQFLTDGREYLREAEHHKLALPEFGTAFQAQIGEALV